MIPEDVSKPDKRKKFVQRQAGLFSKCPTVIAVGVEVLRNTKACAPLKAAATKAEAKEKERKISTKPTKKKA
jgi:hypothetical protein